MRLEAQRVHVAKGDRTLRVKFPDPPASGVTVVNAHGLSKAYGGPPVFEDVSFDVGRGDRLLVLGLNGAGKTSLLRILAGETTANLGMFSFGHNVNVGYYAQEHDNLQGDATLLDNIRAAVPTDLNLSETHLRGLLGMMGLSGEKVFQESATLSGGEKTKLALAMLMVGRNNLLLLDEPTNNLDPPSRQSVTDSLKSWKGTIIFVSHDTEFVEQLRADQGVADARRSGRLLQRRLARARLAGMSAMDLQAMVELETRVWTRCVAATPMPTLGCSPLISWACIRADSPAGRTTPANCGRTDRRRVRAARRTDGRSQ